ncbi:uncharacterized protein LOC114314047 [Camellia sinensis]|uniref:uncharacterized protein LOC114314047 n=1 Tax=Camellia sinensis TaxID=4442 RepID=UPI001036722F|nr:uncharacterized protein LOC114314047 [Camellia sinensis]
MASESKSKSSNNTNTNKNTTKRKQRYFPFNTSVKKGSYPLRPGVQGFFITCDGGRERQAFHESIIVINSIGFCGNVSFFSKHCIFAAKNLWVKIELRYKDTISP